MSSVDYEAQKALASANRAFYRAFEARDMDAMAALWIPSDAVRCVHPGGEWLVGIGPVLASWQGIFEGTPPMSFELLDPAVQVEGDAGWATHVEHMHGAVDGEEFTSRAAATNVFRRTDRGWRMLMHHASPITRLFQG